MPWKYFTNFLLCFSSETGYQKASMKVACFHEVVQNAVDLSSNLTNSSIASLIYSMKNALCADPRDRVYGILGLGRQIGMQVEITPDYSKSVAEVYLDLTIHTIQISRYLDILCLIAHGQTGDQWLSWVPRLGNPDIPWPFFESQAATETQAYVDFKPGRILKSTGLKMDRIVLADTVHDPAESIKTRVRRWMNMSNPDEAYVD